MPYRYGVISGTRTRDAGVGACEHPSGVNEPADDVNRALSTMFVIAQEGQQIRRAPLSFWKTSDWRPVKIRYPNDFSNSETVDRYATVVVTENYTTMFRKILMLPFRTWTSLTHNNTCYHQTGHSIKIG
jgi:hypothetical protein